MKLLALLLTTASCFGITQDERDLLQFNANVVKKGANQAQYASQARTPMVMAVLPEDNCGACNLNPTIANPPIGRNYLCSFDRPTTFYAAEIWSSTNLVTWERKANMYVEYIKTGTFNFPPIYSDAPCIYFRLRIRVTP